MSVESRTRPSLKVRCKKMHTMLAFVLVLALHCLAEANCTDDGWTVRQLKQSHVWKDDQIPLIITKSDSLPESVLEALVEVTNGSNVIFVKIVCSGSPTENDVCQSLRDQSILVRVDGALKKLDTVNENKSESDFVLAVLQLLLSSSVTQLWSYSDLTKYTSLHPQCLLALAPNSKEYADLLSALLKWPIPLGVAMTSGVLPLSQRRQYIPPPSLLRLWYVVQGQQWYSNQDMTGFSLHVVQKSKKPVQLIREFVERVHYPVVTRYIDDKTLRWQFASSGLHIAIVFPGLRGDNKTEPEPLAVTIAQSTLMNYAFVIMPDRSRLRKFVMDSKPSPYIIVLPYGLKIDMMRWAVDGKYLVNQMQQIIYTLRAYAVENPRLCDGQNVFAELGPSVNQVSEIKKKVASTDHHIFAYFCLQGSQQCIKTGYKVIRELLTVLRVTNLGKSFGAHVVIHKPANVNPFKLKNLITCAMYNHSTKAWTVAPEEIVSGSKALQFISKLTNKSELWEIGRVMSHVGLTLADVPPPPQILQEDDPFNLISVSLPHRTMPKEIHLTSYTFDQHIAKFSKTVVVYCVRWNVRCNVFLHYATTAHRQLNKTLNVSLATVSCDKYTELCINHQISSYPTVLLFTPTTINAPKLISGIMDSTQLLLELGEAEHNNHSLAEFTPRSLPSLLNGCFGLNCVLVLWCDRDTSSDTAEIFRHQAFYTSYSDFIFAWINSDEHSHLLSRIIPETVTFPAIVALGLKQQSVYNLYVEHSRQTFESNLTSFLKDLHLGTLKPFGYLAGKEWLPLQPPILFHSTKKNYIPHQKYSDHSSHLATPYNYHMRHHPHTEL